MMVALCSRCHELIEFDEDKNKLSDLNEKEQMFQNLVSLHKEIERNGLNICLKRDVKKKNTYLYVRYVGRVDYLRFYTTAQLLCGFQCTLWGKFKDQFRLKPGFNCDKLRQASGSTLDSRNGKLRDVKFYATNESGKMIYGIDSEINIENEFNQYVSASNYWKLIE